MWFDGWDGLLRVLVVGGLAYIAMVVLLRVSGKGTLTKFNAFDFIVTVAQGSTLATVLLSNDVALAEGVLAFAVLIYLQYGVTWLSERSPRFQALIKAEPSLLLHKGRFIDRALVAQRITREEVLSALRGNGTTDPAQVEAVVLETDGTISILKAAEATPSEGALANVPVHDHA